MTVEDSAFVPCSCIHILSGRISGYSLPSEMLMGGGMVMPTRLVHAETVLR